MKSISAAKWRPLRLLFLQPSKTDARSSKSGSRGRGARKAQTRGRTCASTDLTTKSCSRGKSNFRETPTLSTPKSSKTPMTRPKKRSSSFSLLGMSTRLCSGTESSGTSLSWSGESRSGHCASIWAQLRKSPSPRHWRTSRNSFSRTCCAISVISSRGRGETGRYHPMKSSCDLWKVTSTGQ